MTVSDGLGAGFLEAVYENALAIEFEQEGLSFCKQYPLSVTYREQTIGNYIADFIVENKVIIELKALSKLTGEHEAQIMNYLKATDLQVGLLLNFGTPRLGVKRIVLNYDEEQNI